MPNIVYYRQKCIGCGSCAELQADRWRMSKKDGKAILIGSIEKKQTHTAPLMEHERDMAWAVARACPVKIIRIL